MESEIRTAIEHILKELGVADEVDFVVEHPAELSHGDYATNVVMVVAKKLGKNPRELAEEIVRSVVLLKLEYVDTVEVAGPGFINFRLSRDFFVEKITTADKEGGAWGKNDIFKDEEVVVEYTSPNLFKPLHVGNLVGNIIGESLTRLYEWGGAKVHRVNYPSDIGLTVAKGVWGLQKTGGSADDIEALGVAYKTGNEAYEADGAEKKEIDEINAKLYAGTDAELIDLRSRGIMTSLKHLEALLQKLGTVFDAEIFESETGMIGAELVRSHLDHVFDESEGAIVFRGEEYGLHTRVFINSKGLPTYEAKDLGNFALKEKQYPSWTKSIIVTGSEQIEYFKVLIAAIKEVFPEAKEKEIIHVPTGFLTLTTGKMSSRKGNVLTGESILTELEASAEEKAGGRSDVSTEVAVGALKYQILKHGIGSDIVFDKEKALSFEGDSGPYLQYSYARISSVLEKASHEGVTPSHENVPETPYDIEKILYQFPEVVERAAVLREPHHVVGLLTELAGAFNTFYSQEKIADNADIYAPYKVLLTQTVGQTLKNGLQILGIKAPERM